MLKSPNSYCDQCKLCVAVHSFELSKLIFSYARYFVLVIVLVIPDILFRSLAFVINNSQRNNNLVLQIITVD